MFEMHLWSLFTCSASFKTCLKPFLDTLLFPQNSFCFQLVILSCILTSRLTNLLEYYLPGPQFLNLKSEAILWQSPSQSEGVMRVHYTLSAECDELVSVLGPQQVLF